jgi:hypothetical protein
MELVSKWIEALESGKYTRGTGALYYGGAFCCLGVLAEVAGVPAKTNWNTGLTAYSFEEGVYNITSPTEKWFLEKTGFDFDFMATLMHMNDVRKYTFKEIADYIKANYEKSLCT